MTTESNRPSHGVYIVEGEGKKAFWTKIGAAWTHEGGEGFTINLTCLPLNGRLVVRKPRQEDDKKQNLAQGMGHPPRLAHIIHPAEMRQQ